MNNFINGFIHGLTFAWWPSEPNRDLLGYTLWVAGVIAGLAGSVVMIIRFLLPIGR